MPYFVATLVRHLQSRSLRGDKYRRLRSLSLTPPADKQCFAPPGRFYIVKLSCCNASLFIRIVHFSAHKMRSTIHFFALVAWLDLFEKFFAVLCGRES